MSDIIQKIFPGGVPPDEKDELHRILNEKVEELPNSLHRAFILGWQGECKDYSELAEALSILERKKVTVSAVKKRIERAKDLLEEKIKNEYREED